MVTFKSDLSKGLRQCCFFIRLDALGAGAEVAVAGAAAAVCGVAGAAGLVPHGVQQLALAGVTAGLIGSLIFFNLLFCRL